MADAHERTSRPTRQTPRRVDPGAAALAAGDRRLAGEPAVAGTDAEQAVDAVLLRPLAPPATPRAVAVDEIRRYEVREGDTLTSLANRFGTTSLRIWSANHLEADEPLRVGQELVIPASDGTLHTVAEGETLASIAEQHGTSQEEIVRLNSLVGAAISVGQQLVLPAAPPATPTPSPSPSPPPTPEPTPVPAAEAGGCSDCSFGGALLWPVPGGDISQGYHAGHQSIDIAAPYGTPVLAAASGTVIFAGWKNNGGGWQVWLSHGSDVITTYNHMSGISVSVGAAVAAGRQVGSIGASGWATGPHLHLDMWIGYPWKGGYRVNPLGYF